MHIILVSNRLATAKTVVVSRPAMIGAVFSFFLLILSLAWLMSWVGMQFRLPFAESLALSVQQRQEQKSEAYVRDNLNVMAAKPGQLQAQLQRLDSLGERVSALSGVEVPNVAKASGGQGGPLILAPLPPALSREELNRQVDQLAEIVDMRSDSLSILESQLMDRRLKSIMLPTSRPVKNASIGSGFGYRSDPIIGVHAMHEGLDFNAPIGSRVTAAAGGIVVAAKFHPEYGNMVEIDHGKGFVSRYAHMASISVRNGQVIRRGREVGTLGNTGRSTGPHLHFEVRYKGVAQDPARFLRQDLKLAKLAR